MKTQEIKDQIARLKRTLQEAEDAERAERQAWADDNPPIYGFTIVPKTWNALEKALGGIRIQAMPSKESNEAHMECGLGQLEARHSVTYVWYTYIWYNSMYHTGGGYIVLDFGQSDRFTSSCPCSKEEWESIKEECIPAKFAPKNWVLVQVAKQQS